MLRVDTAGLHAVAAGLAASARTLAELGAQPPMHPPLAADETSMSVASRFSERGMLVASRAVDGAAVLDSAARAINQAALTYSAMDAGNQAVVSLQGSPVPPTPASTPAITADLPAVDVPIAGLVPRPAEVTAAIMEAGQPGAGAPFISGCAALSEGFSNAATAARAAASAVAEQLQGQAGPRISAALTGYAQWAQAMSRHTDNLAQLASQHKTRFAQAKQATPSSREFADRHRQLQNAIAVHNSQPSPGSAAAVAQAHGELTALGNRTQVVAAGYHTGELPAAPPGPPPVVPIVEPAGGQPNSPSQDDRAAPQDTRPGNKDAGGASDVGDSGAGDELPGVEDPDDPLDDPVSSAETLPAMAAMLPSMLTGLLGGVVGAAVAIPERIGQQAQGLASEAAQGVAGLTSGLAGGDELDETVPQPEPGTIPADVGSGGGGGITGPAAGGGAGVGGLKPAPGGMYGSAGPVAASPPVVGYTGSTNPGAAAAGMGGGMIPPMLMPPMAGTGGAGSGTRAVKDPNKTIVMPERPNSEQVKGEGNREFRHTATVEESAGGTKKVVVNVKSRTPKKDGDNQ